MHSSPILSRRRLLQGAGVAVALPLLESMRPAIVRAGASSTPPPVRAAYLYFPNGVNEGAWDPVRVGRDGRLEQLNRWMAPLEGFRDDLLVIRRMSTPRGNGHAAGTATWLTGGGFDAQRIDAGGMSVDQIAARHVGQSTLLPSLELSTAGQGAFSNNLVRNSLSWSDRDKPLPRLVEPRVIFDRMFRTSRTGVMRRSVLDRILDDARSLRGQVSHDDTRKVDEYLDSIRSVERRLEFADRQAERARRDPALRDRLQRPNTGIPDDHGDYVRLLFDMIVLGFWADATRVTSFMLDHGQSNRYFNFIDGVRGTWHALSHWRDTSGRTEDDDGMTSWSSRAEKQAMYNRVVAWHHEQVAYFLGRLKAIDEEGQSLLDRSAILYGSSLADGHAHASDNLPLIMAGRAGGAFRTGRMVQFRRETSMSRLHLTTLQAMNVPVERFAETRDSVGEFSG